MAVVDRKLEFDKIVTICGYGVPFFFLDIQKIKSPNNVEIYDRIY